MNERAELEARLRRHGNAFDGEVPERPGLEGRILARAVATLPTPARVRPVLRELALAAGVLLAVAALGVGVIQLRAARHATALKSLSPTVAPTLGPHLSYTPGIAVPAGPIALGSAYSGTTLRMFTPLRGWAVGPPGNATSNLHDALLVTVDGGTHWRNVTPPGFSAETNRIHFFLDLGHAWVALTPSVTGRTRPPPASVLITVFRTADGGASWQRMTIPVSDGSPTQLDFVDAAHGWLLVQTSKGLAIYRTTDGGAHWSVISRQPALQQGQTQPAGPLGSDVGTVTNLGLSCRLETFGGISFRDASTGWITGLCTGPLATTFLYVSHDAGKTWQAQAVPTFGLKCPCPISSTLPRFTSGREGSFMVSASSLQTACETVPTGSGCGSTAIPQEVLLLVTGDGGRTWSVHGMPGVSGFGGDPTLIDGRTGWFAAAILKPSATIPGETSFDRLYTTHDGGATWTPLATTGNFHGGSLDFVSPTTGWALSDLGQSTETLLETTDGGRSWQQLRPIVIG